MTEREDRIGPDEAQEAQEAREALEAIQEAEGAGLRRAMPPRWFGAAVALITGALLAATAAGYSTYIVLLIVALVGVMEFQRRKAGASPKAFPSKPVGILALIGLLAFFLLLTVGARVLTETYGFAWAPLAGGALIAIVIYLLSVSERREYFARIGREKDE